MSRDGSGTGERGPTASLLRETRLRRNITNTVYMIPQSLVRRVSVRWTSERDRDPSSGSTSSGSRTEDGFSYVTGRPVPIGVGTTAVRKNWNRKEHSFESSVLCPLTLSTSVVKTRLHRPPSSEETSISLGRPHLCPGPTSGPRPPTVKVSSDGQTRTGPTVICPNRTGGVSFLGPCVSFHQAENLVWTLSSFVEVKLLTYLV